MLIVSRLDPPNKYHICNRQSGRSGHLICERYIVGDLSVLTMYSSEVVYTLLNNMIFSPTLAWPKWILRLHPHEYTALSQLISVLIAQMRVKGPDELEWCKWLIMEHARYLCNCWTSENLTFKAEVEEIYLKVTIIYGYIFTSFVISVY